MDRLSGSDRETAVRWPDLVLGLGAAIGAAGLWWALSSLAWATRRASSGVEETITRGPTGPLRIAIAVSIAVAALALVLSRPWLRTLLLVSGLAVLVLAVVEALSSIARANEGAGGLGATTTSYGPGAIVGVLSAALIVLATAVGVFATTAHGPSKVAAESTPASS